MASSSKPAASALTIAGITVATGLLAYAVYFDYKRRNDAAFRKKLRA
jgi:import receptor subunit TOM20